MKIIIALALVSVLAITGCATKPNTNPNAATVARINSLAFLASSAGATALIAQEPDTKPKIALAYQNLNTLVEAKAITGAELRSIVGSLPVDALQSGQAKIAIEAATVLYDLTVGDKLNLEAAPYVLAAATGIRDGFKVALGQ